MPASSTEVVRASSECMLETRHSDDSETTRATLLLIGILSVPAARELRDTQRHGYLQRSRFLCPALIEYRFVLSTLDWSSADTNQSLQQEAQAASDLLFVDAPNGFDFISHKVKLFIDWAVQRRQPFKYLLKTDDDASICLGGLLKELRLRYPTQRLYMGKAKLNIKVERDPSVRQYNSRFTKETGLTVYPPYAGGSGYVISFDVAVALADKVITDTSPLPFRHFPREDVRRRKDCETVDVHNP